MTVDLQHPGDPAASLLVALGSVHRRGGRLQGCALHRITGPGEGASAATARTGATTHVEGHGEATRKVTEEMGQTAPGDRPAERERQHADRVAAARTSIVSAAKD